MIVYGVMIRQIQTNENEIFYLADFVTTKGLIKDMKITTEMVSLVQDEKEKIKSKK